LDLPVREIERYHAAAVELAGEARRIVKPALERGFSVETKADASLVTDVDRGIERRLREMIERWFPDHGVIGEEYPPTRPDSEFQWIMDPIDGTEEFVHGIPTFGAMLALHHRAPLVGVIDHPALDLLVSAGRGVGAYRNGQRLRLAARPASQRPEAVRLVLSARLNFTRHLDEGHSLREPDAPLPEPSDLPGRLRAHRVVMGAADAMVDMHNHVWDLAPSQVLIEEAGGRYAVVRDFPAPDGERILSAVFGQTAVVDDLVTLFRENRAP
jgi:fructose-1,6-bisphosphatase/inositol monophosphatase family enzyme